MRAKRIVRTLRIVMPAVALACAVVLVPWDVVPWITPLPATVQQQVDAATDHGLDGIVVYVDRAGSAPAFYAAGWKNKTTHEPADPHALFKIASIHKMIVAAATAKLVASGRLSLDATLAEQLPELAGRIAHADRITVRMLVRHRSGIPDYIHQDGFDWFTPRTDPSADLALVLDAPAAFEPGARYGYSNTNYLLLGRILDRVLGYPKERYIEREILTPLGMRHTYLSRSRADPRDVASGYWYGYDDDLSYLDDSAVATAQDIGVFVRALNDGTLLKGDAQAIYAATYRFGHTGWLPGYYGIARYHRDIDTVVVQFVNTTGGDTWGPVEVTGGKALAVSNILYGRIVRILRRQARQPTGRPDAAEGAPEPAGPHPAGRNPPPVPAT